ncbi:undecaprenyl-phosphate glucose phosphotransferase [Phototrophicus methaneseepsis]|uniref:Undecaprenyl-phosphate glucose phosphotransferase n=1 Tax=Phototrophicus methaneseepsis TaxID=2710758 RepID=A0A7S8E7N3_9CHLR|nr:undecaprenyl-phosphate glucose phosphotransferase [Phototrophicus methaneseepsis]QPC81895.1 undecaprenyl-phosphate glucose phosphotransferase [Phototrophicus methaneseepsis]
MARDTSAYTAPDTILNPIAIKRTQRIKVWLAAIKILVDMTMLVLAFIVGYQAREVLPLFAIPEDPPDFERYGPTIVLQLVVVIFMFFVSQLYHQRRTYSRFDRLRALAGAVTIGSLIVYGMQEFIFRNTLQYVNYPRSMFTYVWLFSVLFVAIGREVFMVIQNRLRERRIISDNLLIIGTGRIARDILGKIKQKPSLGYTVVGVITSKDDHQGKMLGVEIVGDYDEIPEVIDKYYVDQVIIALPDAKRAELVDLVTRCQRGRVDIKVYPDIFAYMAGDLNVDELDGTPLLTVRDIALRGWKLSLKRGMDVFGAAVGLIFLSPLMLLTGLVVYLESKGPVFYTQMRMGLDGRPFPMIKFRSMRADADKLGDWTVENDPRVTHIGSFMRRTNWDEIPQLINVLLGHMSLVGPRPEQPQYVREFRERIPRYMERHREKAGMTGWAQIQGLRGDTSIAQRTRADLWYIENWSLWLDIKIVFWTIAQTLLRRNRNAY